MKLSSFLRWGSRKEPAAASGQPKKRWGRERRSTPRQALNGPGEVFWTDAERRLFTVSVQLVDASASGVGALIDGSLYPPEGTLLWLAAADGEISAGFVKHASPEDAGVRVGIAFAEAGRRSEGWGAVRLRWLLPDGQLAEAPGSTRNAGDGNIEINCADAVPPGALVMLDGLEYRCLCQGRLCEPYGDRHLLEVRIVSDAYLKAGQQAA